MLCWGYWSLGQPGISANLQGIVAEPQVCGFISDRSVKEVACGGNHSVFLLEDGEVYTCGLNTKGQLGHEREGNKPGKCTLSALMTGEKGWGMGECWWKIFSASVYLSGRLFGWCRIRFCVELFFLIFKNIFY